MFKMTEFFYIGVDQYGCSYEGTVWHYTRRLAAGVLNEVFGNTSFVYFRLVA